MTRTKWIAVGISALVSGAVLAGVIAIGPAGAASSTWSCTVTGENGGTHKFTVQADDQPGAIAACKTAWVNSATFAVSGGTTTTTSTSTSSTTTTIPPGPGYPSLTAPFSFNGGFDPDCQLLGGDGGWNVNEAGSDHPGSIAIEQTNVGEGSCSAKTTIPAGSSTGRAELQRSQVSTPVTLTWEALYYLPSTDGPDHGYLDQTKQGSNSCSNGGLILNKTTNHLAWSVVPSCSAGSTKLDLGPPLLGQWFAVKTTEQFADAGSLTVSIDPDGTGPAGYTVKIPPTNVDTLSGSGVKLRQGHYGDEVSHPQSVYIDGFHVAIGG